MACAFVTEAGFDFIGMMKKFKSTGLWNNVIKVYLIFLTTVWQISGFSL